MNGEVTASGTGQVGTYTFPTGSTTITYIVTDDAGNTAEDQLTVTVSDDENPVIITHDITIALDANGSATISTADIDNGSNDNCEILSMNPVIATMNDKNYQGICRGDAEDSGYDCPPDRCLRSERSGHYMRNRLSGTASAVAGRKRRSNSHQHLPGLCG
jgi:hypothetical protein